MLVFNCLREICEAELQEKLKQIRTGVTRSIGLCVFLIRILPINYFLILQNGDPLNWLEYP